MLFVQGQHSMARSGCQVNKIALRQLESGQPLPQPTGPPMILPVRAELDKISCERSGLRGCALPVDCLPCDEVGQVFHGDDPAPRGLVVVQQIIQLHLHLRPVVVPASEPRRPRVVLRRQGRLDRVRAIGARVHWAVSRWAYSCTLHALRASGPRCRAAPARPRPARPIGPSARPRGSQQVL